MPLPFQKMELAYETLQLMAFGVVLTKEVSSTFVCLICLPPQIPASPLLPPIVNMRNEKYGLTNREYWKLTRAWIVHVTDNVFHWWGWFCC